MLKKKLENILSSKNIDFDIQALEEGDFVRRKIGRKAKQHRDKPH